MPAMLITANCLVVNAGIVVKDAIIHSNGNPTIRHEFTADAAAMVYMGMVYLYTSHDEEPPLAFKMATISLISIRI